MDGIPINTADGLFDVFRRSIRPPTAMSKSTRARTALRFGANSLGGAINFVTPTGRDASPFEARIDAGSFGFCAARPAPAASAGRPIGSSPVRRSARTGFREHSNGHAERSSANFGYQFSPDAETRFYVNANSRAPAHCRAQVTRPRRSTTPEAADPEQSCGRTSSATSIRCASPTRPRCASAPPRWTSASSRRHATSMHPIFQWLDYCVRTTAGSSARQTTG